METQSGPCPGPDRFVPRTVVLRRWQSEWERWADSAEAAAGLECWSHDSTLAPHAASVSTLLAACGRDTAFPVAAADRVLAALVGRARVGDLAASRVVLERLAPALTGQARRRCGNGGVSFGDVFAELVGAAWIVIRCYPLERRPVKVAANLVRDTVGLVFGYVPVVQARTVPGGLAPQRRGAVRTDGQGAGDRRVAMSAAAGQVATGGAVPAASSRGAELFAVLLDGRAAGVPVERLRVLAELGIVGLSQREVAARAGVSERAVRARRDAAVGAMRVALLPAVA
ncbi:hypothetical protein [Pseudofrankia sp. DC12]|uniref:hypothetical protein n=1 Tax=Pseudofrankia sp. DC12 TaxID=683315 RepID=UPI0005F86DA2|nr:hypothetical protein [Pseudofrankia sp. DC12]